MVPYDPLGFLTVPQKKKKHFMPPKQLLLLDISNSGDFLLKIETYAHAWLALEDKIEFFGLLLHASNLIGCQIHQAIDLLLKAFHSLSNMILLE